MQVVLLGDGGSAVERLGPTFASEGPKPCLAAVEGVKKTKLDSGFVLRTPRNDDGFFKGECLPIATEAPCRWSCLVTGAARWSAVGTNICVRRPQALLGSV